MKQTPEQQRALLINTIINTLNSAIKDKNAELCQHNLHQNQVPLHGFDMLLKLAVLTDSELLTIAKASGL